MKSTSSIPKLEVFDNNSPDFFCALYEFHQGQVPRAHWHYGNLENINESDFMWIAISAPGVPETTKLCPKPTTISSKYKNYYFLGFYCSIPDSDARGFSRSICLVISNQKQELIDDLFCCDFLESFLVKLQDFAMNIFQDEIGMKLETMNYLCNVYGKTHSQLQPIFEEMKKIYESTGLNVEIDYTKEFEGLEPDKVSIINNDLRDLTEITNFVEYEEELNNFFMKLNNSVESTLSLKYKGKNILPTIMLFGDVEDEDQFSKLLGMENKFNESKFKMLDFRESGVFHHIVYSLMSGRTLIIESSYIKDAIFLGERFSYLIPFFKKNLFYVSEDPISLEESLQYLIVITTKFKINLAESDRVAYLNLNKNYYRGPICSQQSIIYQVLDIKKITTEYELVLALLNMLETLKLNILELSYFVDNVPTKLSRIKANWNFTTLSGNETDFKIYEYWLYSINNKQKGRTIVLNQKLKTGTGIVTFYISK